MQCSVQSKLKHTSKELWEQRGRGFLTLMVCIIIYRVHLKCFQIIKMFGNIFASKDKFDFKLATHFNVHLHLQFTITIYIYNVNLK